MNQDVQQLFAAFLEDEQAGAPERELAKMGKLILKFATMINEVQSIYLEEMTENTRLITDTHAQLRAVAAEGM